MKNNGYWWLIVAGACLVLAIILFGWPDESDAASTTIINVPESTRYGNHTFTEPTGHEGQTCRFVLTQANNRSTHPNTVTLVTGGVTILDVPVEREDSPPSWTTPWVTAGEAITLNLWAEDVSSTGFTVSIECEVPPSTTTPVPSSTTSTPPSTTVTTAPPDSTTTTSTTVPESSSTTTTVATPPPTDQPSPPPTASPPSTVPVIPSGVPTGEGMPETHSLMGAFWLLAAGVSTLIGAGTWAYSRGGDDD